MESDSVPDRGSFAGDEEVEKGARGASSHLRSLIFD
jgi:hypothetical protein